MKKALITGVTGQDGAYLSEFLLNKGYEVHGLKRRSSLFNTDRIDHIFENPEYGNKRFFLHFGDMTDSLAVTHLINRIKPDEIYNLAAMSHVHVSFDTPEYTANVDALGTLRILESIRLLNLINKTKIYQASTSELYGKVVEIPQNETTPFYPRSPYGVAKLYAFWISKNYREAYNIFASNGILFNHESPLRGETFITRKITRSVARIFLGIDKKIKLGNLNAKRDWGHAKDYVEVMWKILQHDTADDWVIATGETYSVREFLSLCFQKVGIEINFKGKGHNEVGIIKKISQEVKHLSIGHVVVEVDKKYFRPTEVELLIGDPTKARKELSWKPKYDINRLIDDMMEHDLKIVEKELFLKENGFKPSKKIDEI